MSIPEDRILYEQRGAVSHITINNPSKHNAMSGDMWARLLASVDKAAADEAVRAVVIKGAGGKAFASGADLTQSAPTAPQPTYRDVLSRMQQIPIPLIAEISGFCLGGGLAIALQADFRIAAEGAIFGIPAAKLGRAYSYEVVARLMSIVGQSQTRRLLMVGDPIGASEALDIGLIDELLPAAELRSRIDAVTQTIAANAPLSVRGTKTIIDEILAHPGQPETERARAAYDACINSQDVQEGRLAFVERRRPVFLGR